ncbi:MAG: polyprenyl synthetase family protein [Myxococcaceae bacterium]|nr:polyprenyl synthetase family protein [Myxococcaceae bacterium]
MSAHSFELAPWLVMQQKRVEAALLERVEALRGTVPDSLFSAMGYSLLGGGKRLRPVLCLAFADATLQASGRAGRIADDAACATEWVHTYSLVHDDLPAMDDDDLRRGRPTSHKVYGEAMAILAGDALLTEAFTLLTHATPVEESAARCRLVAELAHAAGAAGMIAGQVLDIAADRPATESYLRQLHARKTGALIKAACRMGVIAAQGNAAQLEAADTFGAAVGLAFQIADDLLDVTSTAETMGKPTGADAAAGRFTFPAVLGLEASRTLARAEVVRAQAAVQRLEPLPGPLHALAAYALERRH